MFKAFDTDTNIFPIVFDDKRDISISTASPSATSAHFFTGIRSLGKISFFDLNSPPSFGFTITKELKYSLLFNKTTIPGSSTTAERTTGIFLSSPDQSFNSSSNASSSAGHQDLFNYTQGFLYRNDNNFIGGITALESTSTATEIGVIRIITLRKDLMRSSIEPNSVRLEMNLSNTSATGIVTGNATGMVTALNLKNPFEGEAGVPERSFFTVPWVNNSTLDTATSGMTIEAIVRPYTSNSIILWRRLSSAGWAGATVQSENAFIKLELTKNPENNKDAFRFYIRSVTANGTFSENFAAKDVQASGLFVPSDVGVNIMDGKFHHIVVSWGISGINESITDESGAGAIFGYIDGWKLNNREQTDPRLGGADAAGGPTIQSNMFEQTFPIRKGHLQFTDTSDAPPSGNNLFIGISNFNRTLNDTIGDRGAIAVSGDSKLAGGFDGQIQHVRMWNVRFNDGSTGVRHNVGKKVTASSTAGLSFSDFKNNALTGGNIGGSLIGWWAFNERNTITASDSSPNSNSGSLVGRSNIELYDIEDFTITANDGSLTDASLSGVTRTFLYIDQQENRIINNDWNQGRILRRAADGSFNRVGLIYYDHGVMVLDSDDPNAKLNFLWPASGTTGDFGFSVTGVNNAALNVDRLKFNSVDSRGRLMLNAVAEGEEFNFTENPTGVNPETNESNLDDPAGYINTVALFNNQNDLLAIGKLSSPARKDSARKIVAQVKMDF